MIFLIFGLKGTDSYSISFRNIHATNPNMLYDLGPITMIVFQQCAVDLSACWIDISFNFNFMFTFISCIYLFFDFFSKFVWDQKKRILIHRARKLFHVYNHFRKISFFD